MLTEAKSFKFLVFSARFISSRPAGNTSVHRLETFQLPLMIQVSCHVLGPVPPPDDLAARALEPSVLCRSVHGADLFIQTHPSRGSVQPSPRQGLLLEPISGEWGRVLEDTDSPHGTGAHARPVLVTTHSTGSQTRVRVSVVGTPASHVRISV